jgi:NitT/TauT family transport system permease protein
MGDYLKRQFDYSWPPFLMLLAIFGVWELGVRFTEFPEYILPAPSAIASAMCTRWAMLMDNAAVTLLEFVLGFGLSLIVGIPLGIAAAKSRVFSNVVYPLLVATQSIPKLALAPLFVVWLGFGLLPRVLIAFLIAFFPITVNTAMGLMNVDKDIITMTRSIGLSPWQRFFKVELPSAAPAIFAGLKVATAFSVIGAVIGEFLGADKGLGRVTIDASAVLDTPLLFAALALLAFLGLVSYALVCLLEAASLTWNPGGQSRYSAGGL